MVDDERNDPYGLQNIIDNDNYYRYRAACPLKKMKRMMSKVLGVGVLLASLVGASLAVAAEVNVYSYRQPFLIKPLFDAFTKETGIKVNTVYAKKGLVERLKNEGANSPRGPDFYG